MAERWRPAWADIDLDAITHNASLLRRLVAPAELCAVVKADAYGHGSLATAAAAVSGGAAWLAIALVEEGVALRESGIGVPILVLSEPPREAMAELVARRLTPTVYTRSGIKALADVVRRGDFPPLEVHLKVDTGMHRVGAGPDEILGLAELIAGDPHLTLGALWTHFAVADGGSEADRATTSEQIARFDEVLDRLHAHGHTPPLLHLANSAGSIAWPEARRDLVRCGLALYGVTPTPALADEVARVTGGSALRPALSLKTRVTYVRDLPQGTCVSYGLRRPLPADSTVAVAPIGYADGVPRRLFDEGGEVLVRGHRRPLAGVVTMDQLLIDCGPTGELGVTLGDEVVLLGRQGNEEITATEWANLLGTINYEVLCDIGPRVPRIWSGGRA